MTIAAQPTVIVPTEAAPDAPEALTEAAAALTEAAAALTEAAAGGAEPISTSPVSEPSAELVTTLRLMKDNIDLTMKKVEQYESRLEERLERLDASLDDLEAVLELVEREISRADELVERHGKATAALVALHERQRTHEQTK